MAYWIGYLGGAFLIVWGISCLATMGVVKKLDESNKKEYKKKRLLTSLIIGVIFGVALWTFMRTMRGG